MGLLLLIAVESGRCLCPKTIVFRVRVFCTQRRAHLPLFVVVVMAKKSADVAFRKDGIIPFFRQTLVVFIQLLLFEIIYCVDVIFQPAQQNYKFRL